MFATPHVTVGKHVTVGNHVTFLSLVSHVTVGTHVIKREPFKVVELSPGPYLILSYLI
jgi:hypothetical protein